MPKKVRSKGQRAKAELDRQRQRKTGNKVGYILICYILLNDVYFLTAVIQVNIVLVKPVHLASSSTAVFLHCNCPLTY